MKRSSWSGSYIGVMGIDKTSGNPNDSYNQAAGTDMRLVFWRNLVVNAYAAEPDHAWASLHFCTVAECLAYACPNTIFRVECGPKRGPAV